jgi:hypothetical protein
MAGDIRANGSRAAMIGALGLRLRPAGTRAPSLHGRIHGGPQTEGANHGDRTSCLNKRASSKAG